MKVQRTAILIVLLALCASVVAVPAQAANVLQENETVPIYMSIQVRDYNTGIAVANLSVVFDVVTDWGSRRITNRTDEVGVVQMYLGTVDATYVPSTMTLRNVNLADNYTLIKVQNVLIEQLQYYFFNWYYYANHTTYNQLGIDLSSRTTNNKQIGRASCRERV